MNVLSYFIRHSLTHINRERRRTLFVIFCIAAGVAAVVSLRTLGLMIEDALTGNFQAANRGDMVVQIPRLLDLDATVTLADGSEVPVDAALFETVGQADTSQNAFVVEADVVLSESGQTRLEDWAGSRGFEIMPAWIETGPFTRIYKAADKRRAGFATMRFVEAERYPFYDSIQFIDPDDATLSQVLACPHNLAVSEDLAEELDLQVGDPIYIIGSAEPFTLAAIVDRKSEATLSDILNSIFPFMYAPYQTDVDVFGRQANTFYLRMPANADVTAEANNFLREFPGLEVTTTQDPSRQNQNFSDVFAKLVTTMGLASLLIGGIGIANTMIVLVSRRKLETAVLKTIGAQGRDIVLMLMLEALFLGLLGSVLGIGLGLGFVFFLRRFGEGFLSQSLQVAFYPEAPLMGLALGVVVTLVFALLPMLAAARVRPNLVLRPQEAAMPRAGRLVSALIILGLTAVMGLVGGILGAGLGALIIAAADLLGKGGSNLPFGALLWLILLAVVVALGATLLTAYGPAREKPLHVLRYE